MQSAGKDVCLPPLPGTPVERLLFAPNNWKLALLGITTLGAYVMYWYYRNWVAIRLIERRPGIMPAWRAAFIPLWVFACLRRLLRITGVRRGPAVCMAALLSLLNLTLFFCWFGGPPGSSLSMLLFAPLLPVNARLRRLKRLHGLAQARREGFTLWGVLWIVSFGSLQLLGLAIMLLAWLTGVWAAR